MSPIEPLLTNMALVLGAASPMFVGLVLVTVQTRRARSRRASPIARPQRRPAGMTLRSRITSTQLDVMASFVALGLAAFGPLTILLFTHARAGTEPDAVAIATVVATIAVIVAFLLHHVTRAMARLGNLMLGLQCELATSQALDELVGEGCTVIHDVPGDGFNIDHVVVAPWGVFAIETKGRSRPVSMPVAAMTIHVDERGVHVPRARGAFNDAGAARQARGQALWLHRALHRETGHAPWVQSVLVYPGWRIAGGENDGTPVTNAASVAACVRESASTALTPGDRTRLSTWLLKRTRTVTRTNLVLLEEHV